MHWCGATGYEKCEVTRIVAALDRAPAHEVSHMSVCNSIDAACSLDNAHLQRLSYLRVHGVESGLFIKLESTAAEVIFIKIAQDQIGVLPGRLGAAPNIANRPLLLAKCLRTYVS